MCRPPRAAWPLARVLDALLMKMGRTACWLSHAAGRRQASLGTPVPRTPTVAPGPKVLSGLASRRSQGSSTEHRGPQKPAASIDVWRLIGRGRLRFPMLPQQLHDLTSPCDMQGKPSLPAIVGGAGWPSFAINGEGRSPRRPSLPRLLASSSLLHYQQQWRPSESFLLNRKERLPTMIRGLFHRRRG